MLEESGIPTTVIALARNQAEKTRPPRALFVPFQLGRPLGMPEDAAFQRRVLLAALGLLERADGPVILDDYAEDDPNSQDTKGWQPPLLAATARPATPAEWQRAFTAELAALRPAWEAAQARYGRSIVGLAGQPPEGWAAFTAGFLDGGLPTVPQHATPALALRFLCDDIKAMYGEAAQAYGPAPSARQVDSWFWRQTVAGALLVALRTLAMSSENNALKTVGGRFFVPVPWLPAA
jgi:hypothetical protein